MDDGPLTKEFCEEEQNFDDELSVPLICCACTEAKYEVKFASFQSISVLKFVNMVRSLHLKDFGHAIRILKIFHLIIG